VVVETAEMDVVRRSGGGCRVDFLSGVLLLVTDLLT
jgi:hypothetical protein